jgi:hypothetical protein
MRADATVFAPAALANYSSQYGGAMTQEKKAVAHTYTVGLRFYGDQLEPTEISARLNLQPSDTFSQSQNQLRTRKRRPYWAYNGQGNAGFKPEWTCLEEGLEFLLKSLISRKTEIITLACQFDAVWWCGHFQASFDGGPTLSPKLLTEIGSYGIPLSIDNYFSDEDRQTGTDHD